MLTGTVPLLALDHLLCSFGGVTAVDGVSLNLHRGELLGVIGPNGAGKSTLIQLITGFARLGGGAIRLAGERIDGLSPEAIAAHGVARTFQTSRVFPGLSVWDS